MKLWSNEIISLNLGRFPYDSDDHSLQAWNGADTYLIEWAVQTLKPPKASVLVVNDSFGALACALVKLGHSVYSLTDSYVSIIACKENLLRNGLDETKVQFLKTDEAKKLGSLSVSLALMQIPKSNAYYELQLQLLAIIIPPSTPVVVGGMTRDIHNSSSEIYESCIGPAATSLARHKARLIVGQVEALRPQKNEVLDLEVTIDGIGVLKLKNLPGVFSSSTIDEASLLLVNYLVANAQLYDCSTIIDCGCGNGLLGLAAAHLFSNAHIICTDESHIAILSAQMGFEANGLTHRADYLWTDCLTDLRTKADLILCNPPFHVGQSQTLAIAHRMFSQAKALMSEGASLVVVANRHLGHQANLQAYFKRVVLVAESEKFVVLRARSQF